MPRWQEVLPDTEPFPEKQPAAEEKKTDPGTRYPYHKGK